MKYEIIIGLEIHIQAKTKSKMFCRCDAKYFHTKANTHVCPTCLGLPGALPVPNKVAIEKCIKLGLALNCEINKYSKFDRKNYFYPDLPKGYQISQYDLPFAFNGNIEVETKHGVKKIGVTRVHMEEDTGKSLHKADKTLLDFNKSGVPLIEVVTEPDFRNVEEVTAFAKRLKQIVKYADISNADMEKGQMRFELNISLRKEGETQLPKYKVEVKNIGSISVLEKVILSEYERQSKLLDNGEVPVQETRGTRDLTGATYSQRVKEESNDYRYFPEPDIPPIRYTDEQIAEIKTTLPELPIQKKARYISELGLEADLAEKVISTKVRAEWFENAIGSRKDEKFTQTVAKLFVGDLFALMKVEKVKLKDLKFSPSDLSELATLLIEGKISSTIAKQVLLEMFTKGTNPTKYVEESGLAVQNDESVLVGLVVKAIEANPKVVEDFKKNPNAAKFLIGVVMKESKGTADAKIVDRLLTEELKRITA